VIQNSAMLIEIELDSRNLLTSAVTS
jgi:hypothetical protein